VLVDDSNYWLLGKLTCHQILNNVFMLTGHPYLNSATPEQLSCSAQNLIYLAMRDSAQDLIDEESSSGT
jgi:hypothetical protein